MLRRLVHRHGRDHRMTPCSCAAAGFCPVFKKSMSERMVAICKGEVLTPEKCAAYRRNWAAVAAGQRPQSQPDLPSNTPPRLGCTHRGEELRREACQTCAGKSEIKVFACPLHGQCTVGASHGKGRLPATACCADCRHYEPRRPPPTYTLADLTILVTSFRRFDCLKRFLTSCRFYYPGVPIIVADQSGEFARGDDFS